MTGSRFRPGGPSRAAHRCADGRGARSRALRARNAPGDVDPLPRSESTLIATWRSSLVLVGFVDLAHAPCADKTLDLENAEPPPGRQRGWNGARTFRAPRRLRELDGRRGALGVTVRRQERLHLLAHVRIVTTVVREERQPRAQPQAVQGRHRRARRCVPSGGDHSRSCGDGYARCDGPSACVQRTVQRARMASSTTLRELADSHARPRDQSRLTVAGDR